MLSLPSETPDGACSWRLEDWHLEGDAAIGSCKGCEHGIWNCFNKAIPKQVQGNSQSPNRIALRDVFLGVWTDRAIIYERACLAPVKRPPQ